jgi:hypothetical protein
MRNRLLGGCNPSVPSGLGGCGLFNAGAGTGFEGAAFDDLRSVPCTHFSAGSSHSGVKKDLWSKTVTGVLLADAFLANAHGSLTEW